MRSIAESSVCSAADDKAHPTPWTTDGSFDQLLSDGVAFLDFLAFLRDEFSEENAVFWQKCEQYRQSTTDAAQRKQLARLIYDEHVAESAASQVNIDGLVRDGVERRLSAAPVQLFDEAQRHVYLLMKYDSFPRFVRAQRDAELLPPSFDRLAAEGEDFDDVLGKEPRRWSLLPNWLTERRRRAGSVRGDDGCDQRSGKTPRRESGSSTGSSASSDSGSSSGVSGSVRGLSRFIKRLSLGERRTHLPPPPPASRRGDVATTQPCRRPPVTPATPTTRQTAKRCAAAAASDAAGTRQLSTRRATSVVSLNSVALARGAPQRPGAARRTDKFR